jgi:hypothetical protein
MNVAEQVFFVFLFVIAYLVSPFSLIWGWVRFRRQAWPRCAMLPALTFSAFVLASASALLAFGSAIYAQFHNFPFYDPLLMRIFRTGFFLSLSGLLLGVIGIWRSSPLRWHAPVSAFATAVFWLAAAAGE